MSARVMNVFYGEDCLPYKDQDRSVHYPITGNSFLGASNVTEIHFYIDRIGSYTDTWVANSKLPNGKMGNEILESATDSELNEHYVVLKLSTFYTQAKGDLYVSLNGFQGGVEISEDDGVYSIVGIPTIQATGSVKIAIHYATPLANGDEIDLITLQGLLALVSEKIDIVDSILVIGNLFNFISSSQFTNLEVGQVFFSTETGDVYKKTAASPYFEIVNLNYVHKVSTTNIVYGTDNSGNPTTIPYSAADAGNGTIVMRGSGGNITVPLSPIASSNATSKSYVDTRDALKVDKSSSTEIVYGTDDTGNQTTYAIDSDLVGDGEVVRRESGTGTVVVGTPTAVNHATTKAYVDAKVSSAYIYKGSKTVSEINALNTSTLEIGWVYNVSDSGTITLGSIQVNIGDNIAWTGSAWDKLAGFIDLSGYVQKTQTIAGVSLVDDITQSELCNALGDKGLFDTSHNLIKNNVVSKAVHTIENEDFVTIVEKASDCNTQNKYADVQNGKAVTISYNGTNVHIISGNDISGYYDYYGAKTLFSGNLVGIIFADADKNVIFSSKNDDLIFPTIKNIDGNPYTHVIIKTPINTAYVYLSMDASSTILPLLKGSNGYKIKEEVITPIECNFFERKSINLMDQSKMTVGYYYSDLNKLLHPTSGAASKWLFTDMIKIPSGATKLKFSRNGIADNLAYTQFFDENGVPFSWSNPYPNSVIDVPDGARYIRFTIVFSDTYDPETNYGWQLEVGEIAHAYQSFIDEDENRVLKSDVIPDDLQGFSLVKGKKWVAVGDSITEHNYRAAKNYVDFVSEILGLTIVNLGVSGTGYRRGYNASTPNNFFSRFASIPADADIITFYGSGNDLGESPTMGDVTDTWDDSLGFSNSLCAFIKHTFDLLIAQYPLKKFGVITPIPWSGYNPASSNNMKTYSEKLVAICKLYGVPCLNLYEISGLRPWNSANNEYYFKADTSGNYEADGTHPNSKGHEFVSHIIADFINRM